MSTVAVGVIAFIGLLSQIGFMAVLIQIFRHPTDFNDAPARGAALLAGSLWYIVLPVQGGLSAVGWYRRWRMRQVIGALMSDRVALSALNSAIERTDGSTLP